MISKWCWAALLVTGTMPITACGGAKTPSEPTPPGSDGPQLIVAGRPSAVLIEVIGPGVKGITGTAEFTRSSTRGDTLAVFAAGTNLNGTLGALDLAPTTTVAQLQVRVIEASDAANQLMASGVVTARVQ